MSSPPVIFLLTGAWHTPEHYSSVTNRLRHIGYTVECSLLPTNNNARPPTMTLDDDVAQIRAMAVAYLEAGRSIVALMHSYGGIVGTHAFAGLGAGDRKGEASVQALIYMCAFIPFEDESLAGIFGGGLPPFLTPTAEGIIQIAEPNLHFYNDLPAKEQTLWVGKLVCHPTVAQFESMQKPEVASAWRSIPITYLFCRGDQALPLQVQEMMVDRIESAQKGLNVRREYCDAGHSPFLSMAERVVEVVKSVYETERTGLPVQNAASKNVHP